jgi:hypothetical protein
METDHTYRQAGKKKIFLNTISWGFLLWLFGYVLGIIFFAFVPKEVLGWAIMPFGIFVTLWVLFKKIERESFGCYIGLGFFWVVIAIVLDYLFIVKLFKSTDYYKLDVYVYYILTFVLPVAAGWYKLNKAKKIEK